MQLDQGSNQDAEPSNTALGGEAVEEIVIGLTLSQHPS